ncbi:transcriptional regulator GutM [Pseudolactococcus piscium]|uniref:Sorbitol operon activator protein n=1 Tax=Pseudolactococcus piscium MKFS47 TaxID=297352 RepID=A0A0D6DVK6_9LACT|nr:transcriptional regulator GutM [Lactococcus piscium]CEN27525.1 Sorbitol operon activator protein [Lactococcus piscium MKFS47]
MNSWLVFGILAAVAYGVQILFGMHQIKQFNQVYQRMRRGGRVAIGRRPGRIQSGTIMLFALDARGVIKETQKMQGISVLAKFKTIDTFTDIALEALTPYHPLVFKELRITRQTIENARMLYLRVQSGDTVEETKLSLFEHLKLHVMLAKKQVLHK